MVFSMLVAVAVMPLIGFGPGKEKPPEPAIAGR
jgi:hypothetical protein